MKSIKKQVIDRTKVGSRVVWLVRDQVRWQAGEVIWPPVKFQVDDQVRYQVRGQVRGQVTYQVREQVSHEIS